MIEKNIHYFAFGSENTSPQFDARISGWKKVCPDYTICEWKECDIQWEKLPLTVQKARTEKKYGYVEGYLALKIVFENGGIYLPPDTILKKSFDSLLEHTAFFGLSESWWVDFQLGFGACAGAPVIQELMDTYDQYPHDIHCSPVSYIQPSNREHHPFFKRGMVPNGKTQVLNENILLLTKGEFVHPETRVNQCYIYGNSVKSNCWSILSSTYHTMLRYKTGADKLYRRTKIRELYGDVSSMSETAALSNISQYFVKEKMPFSQASVLTPSVDLMIIVPVYQVETYLEQCADSILNQNTKYTYHIVFIDDGSPDQCGAILDTYANDPRVTVIHQKNRGLSGARNRALENICGKYVMFVDSDDYLAPHAVECLMDVALKYDEDVVEGSILPFSENSVLEPSMHELNVNISPDEAKQSLSGFAWGKVIRAEIMQKVCFPEGMWFEDTVTKTILYPECEKIAVVPDVVCYYRKNLEGISSTCQANPRCLETYWITKFYLEEKEQRGHILTLEDYRQFLLQCKRNQERVNRMPMEIQESMFVLDCQLREQYFANRRPPEQIAFKTMHKVMTCRSYKAMTYLVENWRLYS